MKRGYLVSGIICLVFSSFYSGLSITGNVIFNGGKFEFGLINTLFFLFSFTLILIGAVSSDSLQQRLGQMESENPSSEGSRGKAPTGLKRRKWWGGKRIIEQVRPDEKKYALESQEGSLDYDTRRKLEGEYISPQERQKAEEEYAKSRWRLKKIMHKTRQQATSQEGLTEKGEFKYTAFGARNAIDSMYGYEGGFSKGSFQKIGGKKNRLFGDDRPFSREEILTQIRDFYGPLDQKAEQAIVDYITSGKQISHNQLDSMVYGLKKIKVASGEVDPFRDNEGTLNEMKNRIISENKQNIPYVDMRKLNDEGIVLAHGIPVYFNSRDIARAQYNNPSFGKTANDLGFNGEVFDGKIILDSILSDRPALSTYSISDISSAQKIFQPFGIILGEGKIYEASASDMVSMPAGQKGEIRLPRNSTPESVHKSLEQRVIESVRSSKTKDSAPGGGAPQDEFTVSDYTIKGIYALPYVLEDKKLRGEILEAARQYNLPIYTFEEGKGFIPYNSSPSKLEDSYQVKKTSSSKSKRTEKRAG
jgi:hypothetical protein